MLVFNVISPSSDTLSKLYSLIDTQNFAKYCYIVFDINSDTKCMLSQSKAHLYTIDLDRLTNLSEDAIEDIIFDCIELKANLVVKSTHDSELLEVFDEISNCYGLKYMKYSNVVMEALPNLETKDGVYDIGILIEILECETDKPKYNILDYSNKFRVTENLLVLQDGSTVVIDDTLNLRTLLKLCEFENPNMPVFECWLDHPYIFAILDYEKALANMLEYKCKFLDYIAELTPEMMMNIDKSITKKLLSNRYVQYSKAHILLEELISSK